MRNPIKATAREPINRPDTYERFPKSCQFLDCEQQPAHTLTRKLWTPQTAAIIDWGDHTLAEIEAAAKVEIDKVGEPHDV